MTPSSLPGERDVTVIIPSTRRPAFLRTALRSVASQTAVDRIKEVLVSENAGGREIQALTEEFAAVLPVKFVLQTPPGSPLLHARWLFDNSPSCGYVAMLHDDDWWCNDYIAKALSALDANPSAAAYMSAHFFASAEASPVIAEWTFRMWFGAQYPKISEGWHLNHRQMIFAALLGTPAHYSGIVARAKPFRSAGLTAVASENPFDNDRIFMVELARLGSVIYSPQPHVFVRLHPQQDFRKQMLEGAHLAHVRNTTAYVITAAQSAGIDLGLELAARIRACPGAHAHELQFLLQQPGFGDVLTQLELLPVAKPAIEVWRKVGRELLPPILVRLGKYGATRLRSFRRTAD